MSDNNSNLIRVTAADGRDIRTFCWLPDKPVHRVAVISHGMGEHIERYDEFARYCSGHGIAVYGANHRGHGADSLVQGHYDDHHGWQKTISDLDQVISFAKEQHDQQVILIGHSMGSFIARQYAAEHGSKLSGLILCGSNHQPPAFFRLAQLIAKTQVVLKGKRAPSLLMTWLSFSQFSRTVKNAKTDFDWLTRDQEQVQKYIDDPLCGFICTTQFWYDFMGGLVNINQLATAHKIPATLPVWLASGDRDPVGRMGKGVRALHLLLQKAGMKQVDIKLYPDARHELFHETNKNTFFNDLLVWVKASV